MSHPSDTLSASRAHCHRVARAAGSSFYPCFALLSPTKRAAMEALYAFLRHTDDLADGPQPLDERRRSLGVWREAVIEAIGEGSGFGVDNRRVGQATAQSHQKPPEAAGGTALSLVPPYDPRYSVLGTQSSVPSAQSSVPSTQYSAPGTQYSVLGTQDSKPGRAGPEAADASPSESVHHSSFLIPHSPLLPALAAAVREFCIPPEHLLAVLDGVQMDLDGHRYETFDELALYCDRVASAVGLACIYIWGFRSPQALEPARQCGRAFQLTNILRDLKEDAAAGRIYLPADDFRQSGYSAEELQRGVINPGFYRLVEMETVGARDLYRRGVELMDWLDPAGHRIFGMMTSIYYQLLCKIERRREAVLTGRIRLSRWQKLLLAARWFFLPPRRLVIP